MPELEQLALDTAIPRARVLPRQLQDQIAKFIRNWWSPRRGRRRKAVGDRATSTNVWLMANFWSRTCSCGTNAQAEQHQIPLRGVDFWRRPCLCVQPSWDFSFLSAALNHRSRIGAHDPEQCYSWPTTADRASNQGPSTPTSELERAYIRSRMPSERSSKPYGATKPSGR